MPIYEFQCKECQHCFEQIVFAEDEVAPHCPKCNSSDVKKLVSCASFIGTSGFGGCAPGPGKGFS